MNALDDLNAAVAKIDTDVKALAAATANEKADVAAAAAAQKAADDLALVAVTARLNAVDAEVLAAMPVPVVPPTA